VRRTARNASARRPDLYDVIVNPVDGIGRHQALLVSEAEESAGTDLEERRPVSTFPVQPGLPALHLITLRRAGRIQIVLSGEDSECGDPIQAVLRLQGFLVRANTRQHRAPGCRPADRIDADRSAMLALPPVPPPVGWRSSTRLGRDHYVRLDSNDYSVHPGVIGRRIDIHANLTKVRVFCDGRQVADHERVWAKHQTISAPDHLAAARALRRDRLEILRPTREPEVEQRRLTDYDTALGLTDGGVA